MSNCHDEHDNDCQCGHNHEEVFMNIVTEDNTELKCSVISIFDLDDDRSYIALLPVGQEEIILYRYFEYENDEFELKNIDSEEEFAEVEDAFFDIYNEDLFEDI